MKRLAVIAFAIMTAMSAVAVTPPAVLRAAAPKPTPALGSFRCSALIEVTIDRRGFVVDACVLNRDPCEDVGEAAARDWQFEPDAFAEKRSALLRFEGWRDTSTAPSHFETSQPDPYTIRTIFVRSTIRRLAQDGDIPSPQHCAVHGDLMVLTIVPIRHGWEKSPEWEQEPRYWRDRERYFPNANGRVDDSCRVCVETDAEVFVCPRCLTAEKEWLRRHQQPTK